MAEVLASFPVYRSYLPEGRAHLDEALAMARQHRPDLADAFDRLAPVLGDPEHPAARRFQQTSGMVMAKGVEDCAFYRFSRLTSLNEVGGDPDQFALDPARFHELMAERQRDWPLAMTHDHHPRHQAQRGHAGPDRRHWLRFRTFGPTPSTRLLELAPLPDPGFGSLLWQAVLGAWPASRERLHDYAEKAMREAGEHTTWTDPDEAYEAAVHAAVDAAFDSAEVRSVLDDLMTATETAGRSNGLALKLLALTVPGVPDVYQGTELWDHSLADPDNRRPVDFDERARLLADGPADPKLLVTTDRAATAPRPARALHVVRRRAGAGRGGRARARLRPWRRGHRRHPAARRVGRAGWLGRHDAGARRQVARRADRPAGRSPPSGTAGRASGRAAGEGALMATRGRFDVWAPIPRRVRLSVGDDVVPMRATDGGWWTPDAEVPDGEVDYGYLLDDDDKVLPDPRSRRQPAGVHERSRTFDPAAYAWGDAAWTGRQLAGAVVYELHVGTFTPEGTLDAALGRLDHLRSIGVDLVEVMPVNAFNGTHNWGYDGVLWHAVQETYGGPAAYQRFVDGCHAAGLGVIQDVVYNHLGPSGNYLPLFGPYLKAGTQHLGRPGQPRPGRCGGGAPLHPRQRADVARRLSRRRAAAGRRARPRRLLRRAPAGGDRDRGGRDVRPPAPAADADRRVRPQRRQARSPRARPAATVSTRSGATTSTTPCMSR